MDSVWTVWWVSGWLRDVAMSQVSPLAVLRLFVTDTLDLECCRFNLNLTMLMVGPMDPTGTFRNVSGWLRDVGTSAVSGFALSCLIDAYALDLQSSVFAPRLPWHPALKGKFTKPSDILFRFPGRSDRINASQVSLSAVPHPTDISRFNLDAATSTAGPMDPMEAFGNVCGWLRAVHKSQVSGFIPLCYFVVQTLDLHLYRSDLDSSVSPPRSMALQAMFQNVAMWLHGAHAFKVCCFVFLRCIDLYRLEFDSAMSTAASNVSVRAICGTGG